MNNLIISDVRVLPGDSGFLIDDGETSILYDSGFAFTGNSLTDHIQKLLGDRQLDYIFLTHSHYDHVLGAAYVLQRYPRATVVASTYAKRIFEKPSAKATMRTLDRQHSIKHGISQYEDRIDALRVDLPVEDGDVLRCGSMTFTVIALPGHTKCSVGFYLPEKKLLLGTETLGVYFGEDTYLPSYLVGYRMTLESFRRAKALEIERILLPHYGLIGENEAKRYLASSEQIAVSTAKAIKTHLVQGGTKEEAAELFKAAVYKENVRPTYPIDAFNLNTSIMIDLIHTEDIDLN